VIILKSIIFSDSGSSGRMVGSSLLELREWLVSKKCDSALSL